MIDWPSFTLGLLIGTILTVTWWANSKAREWWQRFEQTRIRKQRASAQRQEPKP